VDEAGQPKGISFAAVQTVVFTPLAIAESRTNSMDSNDQDLMLVRDILAREIETINNYQRLLNEAMSSETGGHWREAMTRQKSEAGPNAETEHQTSSRIGLLTVGSLRQS
jgi:hypothetical protein